MVPLLIRLSVRYLNRRFKMLATVPKLHLSSTQVTRGGGNPTVERRYNQDFQEPLIPSNLNGHSFLQSKRAGLQRGLEVVFIFICFAAYAGQLPPDVNESHYLTKAKHFWNPEWAAGDLFLGSSFAHWVFYLIAGWLTQFFSLTAVAWTGRILTWFLLAFGWQRLNWYLLPMRWMAVVSALLFLLLNDQFHLAGEWVVGGLEAKGAAYFLVMMALGSMIKHDWKWVWPFLGLAMAFHVLVGGWAFLAALMAWVGIHWRPEKPSRQSLDSLWRHARSQTLPLLAGLALGLIGVIPPLVSDFSTSSGTASDAHMIYVNHRVAHHLDFGAFPTLHVARFALIIIFGFLLNRWIYGRWKAMHQRLKPLVYFGIGSLVFSFGGLLLSGIAERDPMASACASLLRFYWFRLSDFAIPAATATTCCTIIWYWMATDRRVLCRLSCAFFIVCIVGASGLSIARKYEDPRPRADRRSSTDFLDDPVRAVESHRNWLKACDWISKNTPSTATFITPADQQTFKWYAGRAEVVCWKDVPQDANGIIQWRQRLTEVYEPQLIYANGLMSFSDQQLRALATKYDATHFLILQRQLDAAEIPTQLKQIYPRDVNTKSTFVVLEF